MIYQGNIFSLNQGNAEAFVLLLSLLICWNLELIFGIAANFQKWKHALLNAKFTFTNAPAQFLLGFAYVAAITWTSNHHFGFIYWMGLEHHPVISFILIFLVFDFIEYVYHVVMHKVKRLWMFHAVHHSDPVVDISTTLREHPGETVIRNSFTLIWVVLTGVPFGALLLRQLIQIVSNVLAHVNFRLPEKADQIIGLVFITPNLHHVHHHYQQPYTDCNYGDVLSIWDNMFGTFNRLPADQVVFGVDVYHEPREIRRYRGLLKIPFGKYRKSNPDPDNYRDYGVKS